MVERRRGQDKTFRTAAEPDAAGRLKQVASAVTTSGAHVSATLDPNGAETTYYFRYGRTTELRDARRDR